VPAAGRRRRQPISPKQEEDSAAIEKPEAASAAKPDERTEVLRALQGYAIPAGGTVLICRAPAPQPPEPVKVRTFKPIPTLPH
jgi:hypothetical protein